MNVLKSDVIRAKHLVIHIRLFFVLSTFSVYRWFLTYAVLTTADPTNEIFGLCTGKWGIFTLVGDNSAPGGATSPTNMNFM